MLKISRNRTARRALFALVAFGLLLVSTWGHIHAVEHGRFQFIQGSFISIQNGKPKPSWPIFGNASAIDDGTQQTFGVGAQLHALSNHTQEMCQVLDHLASACPLVSMAVLLVPFYGAQSLPSTAMHSWARLHQRHFLARAPPARWA